MTSLGHADANGWDGPGVTAAASPVSTSLKRTCTSSPTIEVSVHSPSPTLNARRWMVKLPLATDCPAACAIATGTRTGCADALDRELAGDLEAARRPAP